MGTAFWVRRFFSVFAVAFAVIGGAQMLKGHGLGYACGQGVFWGAIATTLFVGSGIIRIRRGQHCAICGDVSGVRAPDDGPVL